MGRVAERRCQRWRSRAIHYVRLVAHAPGRRMACQARKPAPSHLRATRRSAPHDAPGGCEAALLDRSHPTTAANGVARTDFPLPPWHRQPLIGPPLASHPMGWAYGSAGACRRNTGTRAALVAATAQIEMWSTGSIGRDCHAAACHAGDRRRRQHQTNWTVLLPSRRRPPQRRHTHDHARCAATATVLPLFTTVNTIGLLAPKLFTIVNTSQETAQAAAKSRAAKFCRRHSLPRSGFFIGSRSI